MALAVAVAATDARQAAPARAPASKAAAILTWPTAQREQYIAALDSFFLTRTVKAGPHAHMLERGRPLAAFETGGQRAKDFGRFMDAQRSMACSCCRTARSASSAMRLRTVPRRARTFFRGQSITSTLVGAAIKDGYIQSLDDPVTRYIKALHGSAYDGSPYGSS